MTTLLGALPPPLWCSQLRYLKEQVFHHFRSWRRGVYKEGAGIVPTLSGSIEATKAPENSARLLINRALSPLF